MVTSPHCYLQKESEDKEEKEEEEEEEGRRRPRFRGKRGVAGGKTTSGSSSVSNKHERIGTKRRDELFSLLPFFSPALRFSSTRGCTVRDERLCASKRANERARSLRGQLIYPRGGLKSRAAYSRGGRTRVFQKWSWFRRSRYDRVRTGARIVDDRGEKRHNSASYMAAMHRCMPPCIHSPTSRVVIVATLPRPFVPRSDVRAECQLFLRLYVSRVCLRLLSRFLSLSPLSLSPYFSLRPSYTPISTYSLRYMSPSSLFFSLPLASPR